MEEYAGQFAERVRVRLSGISGPARRILPDHFVVITGQRDERPVFDRLCFAVLIPALITIASEGKIYRTRIFEGERRRIPVPKSFVFYMITICLFAFAFADFTLITLHAKLARSRRDLNLLYAAAMIVDAAAFGWLFDKIGES